MKIQNHKLKNSFLKKIFIKICRILGYEIIDQSNFSIPTQQKKLNENLNIQGKKSITLPLGETKISRKVHALTIIFRSCTNVHMLTQNKKRLFEKEKSEYTFRSLNSLIESLKLAKISFPNIKFDIIISDFKSKEGDIKQMKHQLQKSGLSYSLVSVNINEFKNNINQINSKNEKVTENQISNMSNIHNSLLVAKKNCKDLIYFVEDDYIHEKNTFNEIITAYERIASHLNKEIFFCPADYPYLYTKIDSTNIFLGSNKHWRKVDETLCTFLTSKKMLEKYWEKLVSMCQHEHYPFEQPLHDIYKSEYCLSPIPSLAMHCTNINSIFGLPPNVDWKKIWNENENY